MKATNRALQETILERYNCGPVKFSGGDNALYERHLTFFERLRELTTSTGRVVGVMAEQQTQEALH